MSELIYQQFPPQLEFNARKERWLCVSEIARDILNLELLRKIYSKASLPALHNMHTVDIQGANIP
jgi:hypothetical protein